MHLSNLWFLIIALLWMGFFVLEGFDFGVGMLHSVRRKDRCRAPYRRSTPSVRSGTATRSGSSSPGRRIFAAFPEWYATMFSGFYLALVVVLLALIIRGVSFEFRGKVDDPPVEGAWRWSLTVGSALIPLLLGTALGDLLHGLPIDKAHNYTGNFFGLLVPFGLFTGITLTVVCLFLGSTYLALKTTGALHDRISLLGPHRLGGCRTGLDLRDLESPGLGKGFVPNPLARWPSWPPSPPPGWPWSSRRVGRSPPHPGHRLDVGSIFFDLYPHVMVSTTDAAYSLTVANTASPSYTLKVMTVVAIIFFPVVLLYQGWTFWVFRAPGHRQG